MSQNDLNKIPGPKPDPVTHNNLAEIAACDGLHIFQLEGHKKYGPIFCFWLDQNTPLVSINDPVLLEPVIYISERPKKLFAFLEPLVGQEQVWPQEKAKERRGQVIPALNKISHLKMFFPLMDKAIKNCKNNIDSLMKSSGKVNIQHTLTDLSVELISEIVFHGHFGQKEGRDNLINSLDLILNNMIIDQYNIPCDTSKDIRDKLQQETIESLRQNIDDLISKFRNSKINTPKDNLLSILIDSISDPVELRFALLGILLAGYHTTGVGVSWVLYAIVKEPHYLKLIQDEIDQLFGSEPITLDRLSELKLLDQCVKEAMRMYPAASYGARESQEDMVVAGYHIPAHTTLFLPFWAVHMNEQHWPSPQIFNPERFSSENEASRHPLAYMPFGIGARACSGKKLATIEILYITASLIRAYDIVLDLKHEVKIIERFVNWAENDIYMSFTPRKSYSHSESDETFYAEEPSITA